MRRPVTVSLDEELLAIIDQARGEVPRSRYVERLLRKTLLGTIEDPVPVRSAPKVRQDQRRPAEAATPDEGTPPPVAAPWPTPIQLSNRSGMPLVTCERWIREGKLELVDGKLWAEGLELCDWPT